MTKISQLPLSTELKQNTIFIVVNSSGTTFENQQVSGSGLLDFIAEYIPEIHGGEP
jgi:hypothetical protein